MMTTPEFAIETTDLTRSFGRKKAVDSLTLAVPRGATFAMLGRNGSGKTTTIRMLLGLLRPTRGSSRVLGHDSMRLTPATRGRIGYVAESHPLHDWMTVAQEGHFASQFHDGWDAETFRSIIDQFSIAPNTRAATLSRGERAGLSLAITLAAHPDLLILDDAAAGLDPYVRRVLIDRMLDFTRNGDRTILFSTHALDEVVRAATHAAVLDYSHLRATGSVDDIAASARQYYLTFAPGRAPATLPPIVGLLSTKRIGDTVTLVVARPGAEAGAVVRTLGAITVDEMEMSFPDVVTAYLGARSAQGNSHNERAAMAAGGM